MTVHASSPAARSHTLSDIRPDRVPQHVAIIMDGNGRWATDRGLSRSDGHRAGTENVRRTIESFAQAGVRYLTLYAFSTENWERPSDEVDTLISIIQEVIGPESENLHNMGVRIRHIGSLSRLSDEMRGAIEYSTALTQDNERLTLCVAFNYGARAEILEAVRRILREGVDPETVTERVLRRLPRHRGNPRPGSGNTHGRGDAPVQLPSLAVRLCGVLQHLGIVARLRRRRGR